MTIGDLLDQAQEFLHDDGVIWPRAELLNWANDGFRQLLAQSHAVVRPFQLDVPGRTAWSSSQEWEDRHGQGTWRKFTFTVKSASLACTFQWESEMLEGISPTASLNAFTHLWELYYLGGNTDHHMRLVLSKQHERPLKVYHDDKRLIGASVRELDTLTTEWWQQQGDPIFWFPSTGGRDGSYEVYEVASAYSQGYHLDDADQGIPRLFSGSRTYTHENVTDEWDFAYTAGGDLGGFPGLGYRITELDDDLTTYAMFDWELDELNDGESDDDATEPVVYTAPWEVNLDSDPDEPDFKVGLVRSVSSPDRQYMAAPYVNAEFSALGVARDWKTGDDAITIWEIITTGEELNEADGLSLIPTRMGKYVKYYVLSRAFSRKGRGFRPDLAQHFTALFQIGVALLSKLGNLGFVDRNFGREMVTPVAGYRPPLVQLPTTYERF